jgi:hypothetical protein
MMVTDTRYGNGTQMMNYNSNDGSLITLVGSGEADGLMGMLCTALMCTHGSIIFVMQ